MKIPYVHYPFLLGLVLILYLFLAGWIVFRLPVFASPNELLHYEVVELLHQNGRLPDPVASTRADERHQPPFYYLLVGAAALPLRGTSLLDIEPVGNPHFGSTHVGNLNPVIHADWRNLPLLYVGRLVSLLFGIVGIWGFWWATQTFDRPVFRLLAVALFAFHPMVLFLGASLSNDLPVAAMAALLLGYSTTLVTRPHSWRAFALWGILLAVALLTKASAIFLLLLLPFVCLGQWRHYRTARSVLLAFLAAIGAFALCWTVWILYNLQRGLDPLGVERSVRLAELLALRPHDLPLLLPYLSSFWQSFTLDWSVGGVGFGPPLFYWLVAGGVVIGLLGWAGRKPQGVDRLLLAMHTLWIVPVLVFYLASNLIVLRVHGVTVAEGRLLAVILPSLVWLTVGGWKSWLPIRWRAMPIGEIMAWSLFVVWTLTATWLVVDYLPWLYPRMTQAPFHPSITETLSPFLYEEKLALHEVITPERLIVGELTPVDLTWEALDVLRRDYTISLQLLQPLNPQWVKIEAQNSYPGLGMNPTRDWTVGTRYLDRFYVRPLVDLNGPTRMYLVVWVLDGARDGDALTVTRAGEIQDPPIVQSVVVAPAIPLGVPSSAEINSIEFGSDLALIGLEKRIHSDGVVHLTAYWQAKNAMPEDYSLFIHWLDANRQVVAQSDAMPNLGLSPTSLWRSGDVVRDSYVIPALAGDIQAVRLGVYHVVTLARLPAFQADNHLPDDAATFILEDVISIHD